MIALISSLITTFVAVFMILLYARNGSAFILDNDLTGIQKIHKMPVPRIGGVALLLGLITGLGISYSKDIGIFKLYLVILLCSLPVFIAGLIDDLIKNLNIKIRFILAFISAFLAGFFLNNWLNNVGLIPIDYLFSFYYFSIFFTCFAVVGIINSFNIIDGNNGLSSMVGIIIFIGLAYISFKVDDYVLLSCLLSIIGALFGFFVWNYPRGLIFLGDSGAYLIGYLVAELSLLLVVRNPEVSPWFPFLLCLYPIVETLFTIYRRIHFGQYHFSFADSIHLHQIIHRRVAWFAFPMGHTAGDLVKRNSFTSPYLWVFTFLSFAPSIVFWDNSYVLIMAVIFLSIVYLKLYSRIVRFKTPKFLFFKK